MSGNTNLVLMEVGDKGSHHHVHFSEDTDQMGNTLITVEGKGPDKYEAHVGFLQINHRYSITITLPFSNASEGYQVKESTNLFCRVTELNTIDSGHLEVSFEFLAYKERLLREKLFLISPEGVEICIVVLARVLGKGKGTPMLRDGIKCTGVQMEDESEASDWQGYE
ncbi:adipose-secreted signaling protein [Oratosquilla oratoria]|uniref:adipose-secreted signaling protein n=1 Tax=Oratosquilla oratoria TaxID=337810 RepID=UPI003F76677B